MAGIGVGAGVGAVVIFCALGYLWIRHRKPSPADKNIDSYSAVWPHGQDPRKEMVPVEVEGSNMGGMHELNAGELRHELGVK